MSIFAQAAVALTLALTGCSSAQSDAEDAARLEFRDPSAVQFRNVESCPLNGGITGSVNGKNAFGAYVGFRQFIFVDGRLFVSGDLGPIGLSAGDLEAWLRGVALCYGDDQARRSRELLFGNAAGAR